MGWGLRVLDSKSIVVYGAGLYSFFNNYSTGKLLVSQFINGAMHLPPLISHSLLCSRPRRLLPRKNFHH
jgi:hypothetical protein